jgi:hypothetical protein
VAFVAAGVNATIPSLAPSIADGCWHDVTPGAWRRTLCAGIDGAAVSASVSTLLSIFPLPVINGQSVKTSVEVGVLEMWSGIRNDIDWGTLGVRTVTQASDPRASDPHASLPRAATARAAVPAPR